VFSQQKHLPTVCRLCACIDPGVPRVCYMPGPAAAVGGGYGMLEFKLAVSATFLVSLLILIDRCAAKINFFCSVVRCTTMAASSIGLLVFLPEMSSISTRDYRKVAFSASANPIFASPFGFHFLTFSIIPPVDHFSSSICY
jgi:hypothetical protein